MGFESVPPGKSIPDDVNVIIEIPLRSDPVKYEIDEATGTVMVDRFMATAMHYPCNYGYVPHTLCENGDPADVLVLTPFPLLVGSVVRCRPIAVLEMSDEAGGDSKILAVPVSKLTTMYDHVQGPDDLPPLLLQQISHFFEHYKDLESDKWVKVVGWKGADAARQEILEAVERFQRADKV